MSSIEKMSIQGIRSFGPQKSNMQKIEFCHPLTLILGCNGTGKTTIIECLKYVTTGDQPPGTKGGAFVHDPKIAGEREVKAQVRFQFHDVRGKKIVTTRSLLASQKKNKIECRTLDGAMQRIGADGKPVQITSKCADLNREMIQCLGVSKPILDCVIFCHQEESNWPLSEGKALKVRFDDIFASTRYVKALDNIKKVRSSQNSETTTYKAEIKYLKQNKEKAEELRDSLAEVQMKMDEAMAKVEEANEKLKPVQERKEQITLQTVKLFQVKTEIEKMESEKIQLEKNMSELRSNIRDVFTGSIPELQQMLRDFECEVKEKQDTLCQFENRSGHLSRETDRINKQRSQKLTERGRLTEEAKRHDDNIRKRDAKIRKLVNDYGFDGFSSGEITDDKIKAFGEMMRQKMEELSMEAKNIKDEYEEREHTVQKQLDGVREKKTQLEQSERMKADMVNKNKKEMRSITTELSRVEASAGKLDQIKTDLARGECDLKEAEQSCNIDEMKTDVKNLQKQKTELDNSLKELSNEMTRLHLQSSARTQLDMLKKDKLAKDEKIRKIKAKHEDTLIQIFSSVPESNIGRSVVDYVREQENKIKKMTDSSNKMKMDLSNKETNRKNLREKLQSKEKEMKGYEEQIYEVCAGQDIDDGITSLQEKISHLQDDRGAMVGGKHLYEKFIRQLSRHDPSCPVCHRTFDEEQEVQELVQDLQNQLRIVPSKISKAEKDLEDNQKKYDKLMQLKPAKETMTKLQEEIPDLKNKVDRVTKEMEKLRSDIEESDSNLECIQVDEAIAKSIQPDMTLLDQHMTEVRDLERKIVGQQSKLEGEDSGRTLHQVSNEKDEVQLSLDTVNRNLDHKRQKIADVSEQIQTLKATVNSLQAEKLQIERDLQQRCKLEENKTQLSATNHQLEQEIKDAAKQKQPLQNQIEQLLGQKNAISNEKETRCEKAKNEIIDIKAKGSDVKSVQKEIAKYLTECRDEALEECQNQIQSLEAKLSRLENEKTELCTNIDVLKTELADQKVKERELADNLQLCKKQKEVERIDGKLTVEKTKLSGFNMAHLEKEEKKLGIQLDQLSKEKGRAMTEQIGYEARVDEKKKELATDAYKNAETKFMKMLIKLRTTEVAIQDLDKYYKALDQAIMRYHKVKMDEINKIIRELWSKTYRGNDIDYVEIRSDEDPDSSSKARRSYNYRVVMVKGSTALDLRGRCSAGQKVLASIIIRLALAETFCLNCGVLALDEPTTNLDRENIESLANALVEIIHSREKQVNFQLIVITHDVDFIELLGRAQIVDCFWKISKDADACSRINKRPIHELAD